jgi:urate oxidase
MAVGQQQQQNYGAVTTVDVESDDDAELLSLIAGLQLIKPSGDTWARLLI